VADTFTQLWNRVLLRCPAAGPMLARDWVKNAFREVADARRWSWSLKRGQFIVPDLYRVGTATVTQNSSTVTGIGTGWDQSMVDRQFRIGSDPIYTIVRVHSPTALELDQPYGGRSQSAVGYAIYQCYFTAPPDFREFLSVWDPAMNWQLVLHTHTREVTGWDAQRTTVGQSYCVVAADYSRARNGIVGPALQVTGEDADPDPVAIGTYTAPVDAVFTIECQTGGQSGTATFRWRKDTGPWTSDVLTSEYPLDLQDGVQVYWPLVAAAPAVAVAPPEEIPTPAVTPPRIPTVPTVTVITSRQQRMSAMMLGLPFRGPLVDAAETGFTTGNRQAAAGMYSGTAAGPPPPLEVECPPAITATVGVLYNSTVFRIGGVAPFTFSLASGSLPPGLALAPTTGVISGTPTTPGSYPFTIQGMDALGATDISHACGITVSVVPLFADCPSPSATVGAFYSSSVTVTGGVAPFTYAIASGTLPLGLTLDTLTGGVSGTPTTEGAYPFTVAVTDSVSTSATTPSCGITVGPAPEPVEGYQPGDVWIVQCRASQAPGLPRYELWPHYQSNYVFPFVYSAELPDLDEPGAVLPHRLGGEMLIEHALANAARWPGPSPDKPNPYFSLNLARMHDERFNRMLLDMEKDDDEIYEQDLFSTYPALGWPWANPLGDSAWLQSHAL